MCSPSPLLTSLSASFEITVHNASKLLLIACPSVRRWPVVPALAALSEPARSIKESVPTSTLALDAPWMDCREKETLVSDR
jgi:hypothetical protein